MVSQISIQGEAAAATVVPWRNGRYGMDSIEGYGENGDACDSIEFGGEKECWRSHHHLDTLAMIRLVVGQLKVPMDDRQNAGRKAERTKH